LKVAFWGYTPISERPIFRAAQVWPACNLASWRYPSKAEVILAAKLIEKRRQCWWDLVGDSDWYQVRNCQKSLL
jgi:hypothetical protein